ncbi:membralin [Caerostris extrusa]|uniref:Membralin n=1 Tax=Caerostris extrusa TaxID=172846 RepID=A0AAV4YBA5_CAEEX|nr:membralin [Caerostris extrusa]
MPDQGHPVERLLAAVDMVPAEREYARNNNNNNNNQITLVQLRNRLFQVLLYRMSIFYAGCFPGKARKVIEIGILIQAVVCFMVLIYVHMAFVRTPVTCLQKEVDTWSRLGVLRVEISLDEQKTKPFNISEFYTQNSYALAGHLARVRQEQKEYFERMRRQRAERKKKPQVKFPELKITKKIFREKDFEKREILDAEKRPVFVNRTLPFTDSVFDPDCFSPSKTLLSETELFTNTVWHHEKYIIEYSLEYGFLRLSPSARINTTVKVHTVILEPFKDQCFGNQFSRFLLKHVLGYSDILMGSLRYLVDQIVAHDDPKKGYVRNVVTGEYYRFSDKIMDWSSYVYAGVFMIAFTLAVSILLRYSHHQIFVFVVELMHIFEMQSFHVPVAPLITIVLALVGMEALMSEFFNDSVTAFYVIIVVWIADQFDSICCRSNASKKTLAKVIFNRLTMSVI